MTFTDFLLWTRLIVSASAFALSVTQLLTIYSDYQITKKLIERNGRFLIAQGSFASEAVRAIVLWVFVLTSMTALTDSATLLPSAVVRLAVHTFAVLALSAGTWQSWYTRRKLLDQMK